MKIAIISDSHDKLENLHKAIDLINKTEAEELIHCGDLVSPFMLKELLKFKGKIHYVYGNLEDKYHVLNENLQYDIDIHGESGEILRDNKWIAFIHSKEDALKMDNLNKYHILFYGHSHIKKKEKIGDTWFVNPGEIQGRKGTKSFASYDTITDDIKFVEFE